MYGPPTLSTPPLEDHAPRRITFQARLTSQISDPGAKTSHTDDEISNMTHDTRTSQTLTRPPRQEDNKTIGFENPDTDEFIEIDEKIRAALDQTLYQQPNGAEQEIWEDLRGVLRKVFQYAEDVLHGASQTWSHGPSVSSKLQLDALRKNAEAGSSSDRMSTRHGEVKIPGHMAQKLETSSSEDGTSVVHKGNSPKHSLNVPSVSDLVMLKNTDGKTWRVPHNLVREWDVS
jgi:hypothetical protein